MTDPETRVIAMNMALSLAGIAYGENATAGTVVADAERIYDFLTTAKDVPAVRTIGSTRPRADDEDGSL